MEILRKSNDYDGTKKKSERQRSKVREANRERYLNGGDQMIHSFGLRADRNGNGFLLNIFFAVTKQSKGFINSLAFRSLEKNSTMLKNKDVKNEIGSN